MEGKSKDDRWRGRMRVVSRRRLLRLLLPLIPLPLRMATVHTSPCTPTGVGEERGDHTTTHTTIPILLPTPTRIEAIVPTRPKKRTTVIPAPTAKVERNDGSIPRTRTTIGKHPIATTPRERSVKKKTPMLEGSWRRRRRPTPPRLEAQRVVVPFLAPIHPVSPVVGIIVVAVVVVLIIVVVVVVVVGVAAGRRV